MAVRITIKMRVTGHVARMRDMRHGYMLWPENMGGREREREGAWCT